MADGYRILGAEMSPYSVKVRSYFRYKAIPHQWILRNADSQAEYEKHARMPIIPLVVTRRKEKAFKTPPRSSIRWRSFIQSRRSIPTTLLAASFPP
jgi:hypothetical protein